MGWMVGYFSVRPAGPGHPGLDAAGNIDLLDDHIDP
jgi:hypothetical protein